MSNHLQPRNTVTWGSQFMGIGVSLKYPESCSVFSPFAIHQNERFSWKPQRGEKWFFESVWKEDNPEERQRAGVSIKGQVSGKHVHRLFTGKNLKPHSWHRPRGCCFFLVITVATSFSSINMMSWHVHSKAKEVGILTQFVKACCQEKDTYHELRGGKRWWRDYLYSILRILIDSKENSL